MDQVVIDRPLIEAYSRGHLDRHEIAARPVTVADVILALRAAPSRCLATHHR